MMSAMFVKIGNWLAAKKGAAMGPLTKPASTTSAARDFQGREGGEINFMGLGRERNGQSYLLLYPIVAEGSMTGSETSPQMSPMGRDLGRTRIILPPQPFTDQK